MHEISTEEECLFTSNVFFFFLVIHQGLFPSSMFFRLSLSGQLEHLRKNMAVVFCFLLRHEVAVP